MDNSSWKKTLWYFDWFFALAWNLQKFSSWVLSMIYFKVNILVKIVKREGFDNFRTSLQNSCLLILPNQIVLCWYDSRFSNGRTNNYKAEGRTVSICLPLWPGENLPSGCSHSELFRANHHIFLLKLSDSNGLVKSLLLPRSRFLRTGFVSQLFVHISNKDLSRLLTHSMKFWVSRSGFCFKSGFWSKKIKQKSEHMIKIPPTLFTS